MTLLSDRTIRQAIAQGVIGIDPFVDRNIQPCSVDVTLDSQFRIMNTHNCEVIDPYKQQDLTRLIEKAHGESFVIHPHEFVLGSTRECVTLPNTLVGNVEGKSSLGRLGLLVHITAGLIDPGFKGYITLELNNVGKLPILLWPGMTIGQLTFEQLDQKCGAPYGSQAAGSKYQNQSRGPVESRYYLNRRHDLAD